VLNRAARGVDLPGMQAPDVLIVDDDSDIRAMLRFALGGEFCIRFASNGNDALHELATRPPAAMILDVVMPAVDGYDVLEARRERGLAPNTRVLMLTCLSDERDLVRSWSLGADGHLTKPIDPEQIAAKLRVLLAAAPV
jgi:two-component system response regulator ResD